jgi:hypothetical protein
VRALRPVDAASVAAAAGMVVIVALLLARASEPVGTDVRPPTRPQQSWTTIVNSTHGFEVSLPSGWQLSAENLTPKLTDPRELLSAGTFPLRARQSSCNHVPAGALEAMAPGDGFVTVQERGRDAKSSWSEFPPRPPRFADKATAERGDVAGCVGRGSRLVEFWMPFTESGRHFYAMVILGPDASSEVRTQAFDILDRLRFDPAVRPSWRASD